jgi:hypothetical protein
LDGEDALACADVGGVTGGGDEGGSLVIEAAGGSGTSGPGAASRLQPLPPSAANAANAHQRQRFMTRGYQRPSTGAARSSKVRPIMARPPTRSVRAALSLGAAIGLAIALAGCAREISCTAEVTEGAGTFKGTATGARPEPDLQREALRAACNNLCASRADKEGCVSRCSVDAEVGKIGSRSTCTKGGAR